MKILTIGTESKLFEKGSRPRERIAEYGQLCDEMHIVVISSDGPIREQISENVWVYSTASKYKILSFFRAILIGRRILKSNEGPFGEKWIISSQDPFEVGLAATVLSSIYSLPLNVQVHIDFFSEFFKAESIRQRAQSIMAPYILRRADKIRVVSKKIKNYLETNLKLKENSLYCLPIYTDVLAIRRHIAQFSENHEKSSDFTILMVSRLVKQKNIPLAIRCLDVLKNDHGRHNLRLVLIGSGPEEKKIKSLINEYKLSDVVILKKWTENPFDYMKQADVFLLTSNYEGWGMTVVEAQACGCPVVMTDVGCAREFMGNGQGGFIVEVGDKGSIVKRLADLMDNPEIQTKMRKDAIENADKAMTKETYLKELKKIWNDTAL